MKAFQLPNFKDPELLIRAMTHKSYTNEYAEPFDNERLEFLGDAILTFICGEFLYRRYPDKPEGELTQIRASLVDKTQLAELAIALRLNQILRLGRGVENTGGRTNPRLLSSAFEALIGAYFIDQNSNIQAIQAYVEPLLRWALESRGAASSTMNYKSSFQEWSLAKFGTIPKYTILEEFGPDHDKSFVVAVSVNGQTYGQGQGYKKQNAEKEAARDAMTKLGLLE
jgi:ribonuclease-3